MLTVPDSSDGPSCHLVSARRRLPARKRVAMTANRTWHCRNCGRSNTTVIELDGRVTCEFCRWVMRIQPSRVRGGETAGQMARTLPRAYRPARTPAVSVPEAGE